MNYKMMGRFIGKILVVEGVFMVPALLISLWKREYASAHAFWWSLVIILGVSGLLMLLCRGSKNKFYAKDGLACVGISWIVMSLLGCLPFCFSGAIPRFIDAFFEIVSGFTTTGASVVPAVEELPMGILYWRSFSHWLGGMGVLVFLLAVSSVGGSDNGFTMHLLRAESPGPNVGKLVPKMKKTAGILYILYILLTVVNIIFLLAGGMSLFEAVCTAFGTAGTGGFGVRNDSIAGYSPYIQNVCTVFMLLFGVNFSCYYLLLIRQFKNVFRDEELRLYLGVVAGSIVLITLNLKGYYETLGETVRHAAFQVHPQKVQAVRVNGHPVGEKILQNTNAYLAAYVIIIGISYLLVSVDGFSITTNISAVMACFNNVGPGFETVGPACNFAAYSTFSKLVLIMDMLAGRLEIFPILILFSRTTWRHR